MIFWSWERLGGVVGESLGKATRWSQLRDETKTPKGRCLVLVLAIVAALSAQLSNANRVLAEDIIEPVALEESETGVDVDCTAQLFALKDTNGKTFELAAFRGKKPVLLYFWATWCPYCVESIEDLRIIRENISVDELEILAVDVGSGDSESGRFLTWLISSLVDPWHLDRRDPCHRISGFPHLANEMAAEPL